MRKKVIITGGTGAIGAALVEKFSADCDVLFTYLTNKNNADRLEAECGAKGIHCDVTDRKTIDRIMRNQERCDLLINNAGISQTKLFTDITELDWYRMIDIHLTGAFNFSQGVLPYMINQKCGCIINISSIWGLVGASCEVHYSTVKAGLIGFTKALAKEVGPSNVRVNCITPGMIESNMNSHLDESEIADFVNSTSLMKLGTPRDVAAAAHYLADAEFVTGQILGVDGGFI